MITCCSINHRHTCILSNNAIAARFAVAIDIDGGRPGLGDSCSVGVHIPQSMCVIKCADQQILSIGRIIQGRAINNKQYTREIIINRYTMHTNRQATTLT